VSNIRTVAAIGSILVWVALGRSIASSQVHDYKDYVLARADALPEASVQADTITFLCDREDWPQVMGEIAPPRWIKEPPGMTLLIGSLNHDFSCANVELRYRDDLHIVTLRPPTVSAPPAPGGCAIEVSRTARDEPIVVMGQWIWERELATIRTCGERIAVPHTDDAEVLRVRLTAREAGTSHAVSLANSKVLLAGRALRHTQTTIADPDGVAVFRSIPATTGYELIVQPPGCGEFHFRDRTIAAGMETTMEFDLGSFASLVVHVNHFESGKRVPLHGASVVASMVDEHTRGVFAETDESGRAVMACIPSTKVDLRVQYPNHLWEDVCDVSVGPAGLSVVDVLSRENPDPRRRPVPPICGRQEGLR
jgi:hypothetical protein